VASDTAPAADNFSGENGDILATKPENGSNQALFCLNRQKTLIFRRFSR